MLRLDDAIWIEVLKLLEIDFGKRRTDDANILRLVQNVTYEFSAVIGDEVVIGIVNHVLINRFLNLVWVFRGYSNYLSTRRQRFDTFTMVYTNHGHLLRYQGQILP